MNICKTQAESAASQPHSAPQPTVDKVPAGVPRRVAALLYDCLLLVGPIAAYAGLVVLLRGGAAVEPDTLWFSAGLAAIPALFFCWFWTHGGQTLGMVAWRIRLVALDGERLSWRCAFVRYCAALLSLLPAGLGFFWALWDTDSATWHDRLSRTRMVRTTSARGESSARA
jgi:uncharacterized RDD family membrane protein YckC